MTFKDRINLADKYRMWLDEECKKTGYNIVNNPETFLVYLEKLNLLKEFNPTCDLMCAKDGCEEYIRQSNYSCDQSDLCASCSHNIEVMKEVIEQKWKDEQPLHGR